MEVQKSGISSGEPYSSTSSVRQRRPNRGVAVVVGSGVQPSGVGVAVGRTNRLGYGPTTPAQITPALISPVMIIERRVRYPPSECPHMPMRFGSASGKRFIVAT